MGLSDQHSADPEILLEDLSFFSAFRRALFTAPFLARLLVVLSCLENLEDPFALNFLFKLLQRFFQGLVLGDMDF